MRSMTGHGRGVSAGATVEIRSVNHRFFELKLRAAPLDPRVEDAVGQALRRRIERGSVTVALREAPGAAPRGGVKVDVELARAIHGALDALRAALGSTDPVPLAVILAQPGVLSSAEPAVDADALFAALAPALDAALDELVAMRRREGATLAGDLGERLGRLATLADEIEALVANAPAEAKKRLAERIEKLLAGTNVAVDEPRLAVEVAVFADRTDVTEELVRLRSHMAQLQALLPEDAPVGRRMDFLVQEVGREINTIGSKAQNAEVTRRVVEAKAELEKIREQVQNVE